MGWCGGVGVVGCGFVKLRGWCVGVVLVVLGLLWFVIGFTYGCGVCHGGFAAVWLACGGLGVVVL